MPIWGEAKKVTECFLSVVQRSLNEVIRPPHGCSAGSEPTEHYVDCHELLIIRPKTAWYQWLSVNSLGYAVLLPVIPSSLAEKSHIVITLGSCSPNRVGDDPAQWELLALKRRKVLRYAVREHITFQLHRGQFVVLKKGEVFRAYCGSGQACVPVICVNTKEARASDRPAELNVDRGPGWMSLTRAMDLLSSHYAHLREDPDTIGRVSCEERALLEATIRSSGTNNPDYVMQENIDPVLQLSNATTWEMCVLPLQLKE